MKFTEDELRQLGYKKGPDGSWGKPAPPPTGGAGPPDPEPDAGLTLPDPPPVEEPSIPRHVAIITIHSVRPRDHDNLGAKWYIDALVHLKILEDDTQEHLEVVFDSKKVQHFKEEHTTIELYQLKP